MFISVTFPFADYRSLCEESAGRLERPCWGSADPRATFARGFGSIHTRTKSANGFVGENYYADCDNLIRYPAQLFLQPLCGGSRRILSYPFYRRFFFDGEMSGRFELGFRLNEASIHEIAQSSPAAEYDVVTLAKQILTSEAEIHLLDGRIFKGPLHKAPIALRDGYILSSTRNNKLNIYDIETVGSNYVSVGVPFVFIRSSQATKISRIQQKRMLIDEHNLSLIATRSGVRNQHFDTVVMQSREDLDAETARERFARLFYTQIRALSFAHSFYLKQVDGGRIAGSSRLEPAIEALIERLKGLVPMENDTRDKSTCSTMREIISNMDIDPSGLSKEIQKRLKPGWIRKQLSRVFSYVDKKADKAIEAAASTATKHVLTGGS